MVRMTTWWKVEAVRRRVKIKLIMVVHMVDPAFSVPGHKSDLWRTLVLDWINQIMIYCQLQVKLRRLESSWKRIKAQQKRFLGQTESPVCLESNAGRMLFQIVQESNQNTEIMIQLMKLEVCFLMVLSNSLLPALIHVSLKKLLAWMRAQKKVTKQRTYTIPVSEKWIHLLV